MRKIVKFIASQVETTRARFHAFIQRQDQIYYRDPKAYKNKMDWFFFWSVSFFGSVAILMVWGAWLWMR